MAGKRKRTNRFNQTLSFFDLFVLFRSLMPPLNYSVRHARFQIHVNRRLLTWVLSHYHWPIVSLASNELLLQWKWNPHRQTSSTNHRPSVQQSIRENVRVVWWHPLDHWWVSLPPPLYNPRRRLFRLPRHQHPHDRTQPLNCCSMTTFLRYQLTPIV